MEMGCRGRRWESSGRKGTEGGISLWCTPFKILYRNLFMFYLCHLLKIKKLFQKETIRPPLTPSPQRIDEGRGRKGRKEEKLGSRGSSEELEFLSGRHRLEITLQTVENIRQQSRREASGWRLKIRIEMSPWNMKRCYHKPCGMLSPQYHIQL